MERMSNRCLTPLDVRDFEIDSVAAVASKFQGSGCTTGWTPTLMDEPRKSLRPIYRIRVRSSIG